MKILEQKEVLLLESLAQSEAEIINKAFELSKEIGLLHLSNAVTSFKEYITKEYGEVIVSFCSEYRVFIIALMEAIESSHRSTVFSELLVPSISSVSDEDVARIYSNYSI